MSRKTNRSASPGRASARRFLWGYFRPYAPWLVLALASTLVFAGSMVGLLVGFKLILKEVVRTDEAIEARAEEPEDNPVRIVLERWGLDLDLDTLIDRLWGSVEGALGITDDNIVWMLPVAFAGVFLLRSLASFLTSFVFQIVGLGATNDLRNELYERILHQSSRFYSQHPSGELVSRVGNDVAVMQTAVSNRLLDLFLQPVTLLVLIVFLLLLHPQMALICFIVVPAVFYPIVRFGEGMRRTSHRSQERLADLANLVAEAVRGHRVVKAFGMEDFELDRFREATRRHLRIRLKAQLLANASGPVVETLAAFGAAGFLIYVGYEVRESAVEPSQIMTFLTGLVMLYDPIRRLNKVNLVLQEAMAAAERVRDVMEIPQDVVEREDAVELEAAPSGAPSDRDATHRDTVGLRITFEDVAFSYEQESVLEEIDLTIETGQMVALVGPSGAGKSTLVNLLPRFYDPDRGRITLGGRDLRDLTLESLRAQIGIVTQDTVLFNDSIRNNIAYGREDLSLERVREAAVAAYADEFVRELPEGYDTEIGESGLKLSGGQRQRLAIARAILKDPPILILDEATSHLDSESESLVQKALANLMVGRTALVIAHRLSTVTRADRILVMKNGRVVEEGTHDELLAHGGEYQRLHELQFRDA